MYVTSFKAILFCILACLLANVGAAQMLSPTITSTEQVVVLGNGEIIQGKVKRSAEQTVVQTEQGSRLVLSNDRVDFVCNSLEDAYWGKCARTKATDLDGQKRLFYWCLKHELLEQAQNQIALLADSEDAKAKDLEFLDRQLNVAIQQQQRRKGETQVVQGSLNSNVGITGLAGASTRATNQTNDSVRSTILRPHTESISRQKADNFTKKAISLLEPIQVDTTIGTGQLATQNHPYSENLDGKSIDYSSFTPLPELHQSSGIQSLPSMSSEGKLLVNNTAKRNLARTPVVDSPGSEIRQVGFEEPVVEGTIEEFPSAESFSGIPATIVNPALKPNTSLPVPDLTTAEVSKIQTNVTNLELDRMTRTMPKGTLKPYRSRLEKVLANGCSASKCHHDAAATMPLWNPGGLKPLSRRMSQRNLFHTLQYVDRSDPFASRLVDAASKAHGGLEKPVIEKGTKEFNQLLLWVIMLSNDPQSNFQRYNNTGYQPVSSNLKVPDFKPVLPLDSTNGVANGTDDAALPTALKRKPKVSVSGMPETIGDIPELTPEKKIYKPVDPFDPEIFNRNFRKK